MSTLKRQLSVAAVVVALAMIGTIMNSRQSVVQGAGGPTVTIDPSQLPLPIKGSITAGGTVAATQSGPWNVGITGNTAANPLLVRDVDNSARHAFAFEGGSDLGGSVVNRSVGTVPAGQRYVIEHYRVSCAVDTGNTLLDIGVQTSFGGVDITDEVSPHFAGPVAGGANGRSANFWLGSGNVRIYADQGAVIRFFAISDGMIEFCSGVTVSGYSVSLP